MLLGLRLLLGEADRLLLELLLLLLLALLGAAGLLAYLLLLVLPRAQWRPRTRPGPPAAAPAPAAAAAAAAAGKPRAPTGQSAGAWLASLPLLQVLVPLGLAPAGMGVSGAEGGVQGDSARGPAATASMAAPGAASLPAPLLMLIPRDQWWCLALRARGAGRGAGSSSAAALARDCSPPGPTAPRRAGPARTRSKADTQACTACERRRQTGLASGGGASPRRPNPVLARRGGRTCAPPTWSCQRCQIPAPVGAAGVRGVHSRGPGAARLNMPAYWAACFETWGPRPACCSGAGREVGGSHPRAVTPPQP
jgi:hypothetical protein